MKRILPLFIFFISFSTIAQNFNQAKLDSLITYLSDKNQIMGNVSIYQNGSDVYRKAFGYRDVESRIFATSHTLYRIGSVTKTYTSAVIMQLIEENKLQLDTKLEEYFPKIPTASDINIEQLLSHQSGLVNFTDHPDYLNWSKESKTRQELLDVFIENGSSFEPGTKSQYSNTNYVLLTFIAEDIEDKDFGEILKKRIFDPLQLKRSKYGEKIHSRVDEAFSYYPEKIWELSPETNLSIPLGAGAISAEASEVSGFYHALFAGEIVKDSSLQEMTKIRGNYGLGLLQLPYRDKTVYGHTGGIDGFQSLAVYFPEEKTAVTLLLNASKMDINEVFLGVLDIYFGYDYQLPVIKKVKDAQEYIGTYSSPTFPLKLEVFTVDNLLFGQATGQPSFRLTQKSGHEFEFKPAGLYIEFNPEENNLKLTQQGHTFELQREEQ